MVLKKRHVGRPRERKESYYSTSLKLGIEEHDSFLEAINHDKRPSEWRTFTEAIREHMHSVIQENDKEKKNRVACQDNSAIKLTAFPVSDIIGHSQVIECFDTLDKYLRRNMNNYSEELEDFHYRSKSLNRMCWQAFLRSNPDPTDIKVMDRE